MYIILVIEVCTLLTNNNNNNKAAPPTDSRLHKGSLEGSYPRIAIAVLIPAPNGFETCVYHTKAAFALSNI